MSDLEYIALICAGPICFIIGGYMSIRKSKIPIECSTCYNYENGKCKMNPIHINVNKDHSCGQHIKKQGRYGPV